MYTANKTYAVREENIVKSKKAGIGLMVCLIFLFIILSISASAENVGHRKFHIKQNKKTNLKSHTNTLKIKDRQILIKFKNASNATLKNLKLSSVNTSSAMKNRGMLIARIPDNADFNKVLEELNNNATIEYAQPDYECKLLSIPNDAGYSNQWYLSKINLPGTWNTYRGSTDTIVAVIDSGVDVNHPDLQSRVIAGYDYVNNDTTVEDTLGHGTMVSGIIAAKTNNSTGIAGIDWNCKIMPLKAGLSDGTLSTSAIINSIYYAINHDADIINMSFGIDSFPTCESLYEALNEAYSSGIILVAASGNEDDSLCQPACYPFVISAGATNNQDVRSSFSNYGAGLDISAPGENIYTTKPGSGYESVDGTSFSSPIVAGVAALLKGKNPDLTPAEAAWIIESSADMPSYYGQNEWSSHVGYGRINAYSALTTAPPFFPNDTGSSLNLARQIQPGQTYTDYLEMPMDEDWFKFTVSGSNISSSVQINIPPSVDGYAELYKYNNSTGQLDFVRIIDNGFLGENESIAFTASSGTYYLWVCDYYGQWSSEPYSIKVTSRKVSRLTANVSSITVPSDFSYAVALEAKYSDGTIEEDISQLVTSISSNDKVADIYGNIIYGLSPGKATITFSYGGKSCRVRVIVTPALTNITASKDSVNLESGKSEKIYATAFYEDGSSQDISKIAEWGSGNESVAIVSKGKITAVSPGTTYIAVTYGGETKTIDITVTPILVNISSDITSLDMEVGDSYTPVITAFFNNGETLDITAQCIWSGSSSVEVSPTGTITAVFKGKAKVSAKYGKKKVAITVKVTPVLESISFNDSETVVYLGKSKKVKVYAKYIGDSRLYDITKTVSSWTSNNDGIATVAAGCVKGISTGDTQISAAYLGKSASAVIHVQKEFRKIYIQAGSNTMAAGQTQPVKVLAQFRYGEDEDYTGTSTILSGNINAVVVESTDQGMILRAAAAGQSTITASWGNKTAKFRITVAQ